MEGSFLVSMHHAIATVWRATRYILVRGAILKAYLAARMQSRRRHPQLVPKLQALYKSSSPADKYRVCHCVNDQLNNHSSETGKRRLLLL